MKSEFRDKFLFENRLSLSSIQFTHKATDSYKKVTSMLFVPDRRGNMIIYYPSLEGSLETHYKNGDYKESYRTRLREPYKDKNGKVTKYNMEGKNCIFFPPEMVEAYKKGIEIPLLTITEGEKKAFVACKNGFDCVGISGIWNYMLLDGEEDEKNKWQKELMPSLKEFLKRCKVEKVVLLHDSDALDINPDSKDGVTKRPYDFYNSVKRFAQLIFQEGVKFYYSYINPHLDRYKVGLDDLVNLYEDYNQKVLFDFYESVEKKKFTEFFCTTKIEFIKDAFIKDIFKLNSAQEFFEYHKEALKQKKEIFFDYKRYELDHVQGKVIEKKTSKQEPVWIEKGEYYAADKNGGNKRISNFTMEVLFLLKSSTNSKRIVEFKNVTGQAFRKELTNEDFTGISSFRKKLIGDGNFVFKGEMLELLTLQEILFAEETEATEISSLGWQKHYNFWAFANGLAAEGKFYPIDDCGIVGTEGKKFYLPAFSSLYSDADEQFENERNFRHIPSEVSFNEWTTLFTKTYKENGHIGVCFYIASLFRDIIFPEFKEFPILNLFGQKGSGKSTMAKSLMYLFGEAQTPIGLENSSSTKKGIFRKFSQYRNAFIWLDEYKNTIHPDLIGLIKNLYDGIGYERAQTSQDNRTISQPVLSSTILSGQDMPITDPALFTRVILLSFKNNTFTDTDVENHNALKLLQKQGLTGITIQMLQHRELIKKQFTTEFNRLFSNFSKHFKYTDIPDRLLKNAAMILAPISILIDEKKITYPVSVDDLFLMLVQVLTNHNALQKDNHEVSQFWSIIETLYDENVLSFENNDFRFQGDCIAVRYKRIYSAYAEKHRKMFGKNGLDISTLENYLKNHPCFVEAKDSVRFKSTSTSAFIFKYKELGINLSKSEPMDAAAEKDLIAADKPGPDSLPIPQYNE